MWIRIVLFLLVFPFAWAWLLYLRCRFYAWKHKTAMPHFEFEIPFGWPLVYRELKNVKANLSLINLAKRFHASGHETLFTQSMGVVSVFTNDPENMKAILATKFKDFDLGMRQHQLSAIGEGIFTLSGAGWQHSRAMLRPQFARDQVAQLESINDHVDKLIWRIEKETSNDRFCDMQDLFHQLTMDTATEFLFGQSVDSLAESKVLVNGVSTAEFIESYNIVLKWTLMRFVARQFYWLVNPKVFRDHVKRARDFMGHFSEQAVALVEEDEKNGTSQSKGYTFNYELAKVTKDKRVITDQCFNILVAGRDTTAATLSYMIYYMGNDERVWNLVCDAVIEDFGDGKEVTFENLKKCKYLSCVINEVLRLQPIVPRNTRYAVRDTTLPRGGGPNADQPIFVPKGTSCNYSVYVTQRDKRHWGEDADKFRPERWQEGKTHSWDYLPFNGGPRICLGQQFALTEIAYTIVKLVLKYERIELRDPGVDIRHTVRLTSSVAGGVWAKMHPRSEKVHPRSEKVEA